MRKKIFNSIAMILILIFVSSASFAEVDPSAENHKIIGGLYSLAAAIELNAKTNPDVNSLVRFFERIPPGWQNEIKIERDKNKKSIWVGIAVDEFSTARKYLRSHADELGIKDAPGGAAWLGSDFAWLKAADITKNKLKVVDLAAAEGEGKIFFNVPGSDLWWVAWPSFNSSAMKKILNSHGAKDAPELQAPKFEEAPRTSIYDEVRPSSVRVPDKMHMGTSKNSFDMSMEVGDVIFNPIPNVGR